MLYVQTQLRSLFIHEIRIKTLGITFVLMLSQINKQFLISPFISPTQDGEINEITFS